jgi:hypothetical protein
LGAPGFVGVQLVRVRRRQIRMAEEIRVDLLGKGEAMRGLRDEQEEIFVIGQWSFVNGHLSWVISLRNEK